MLPCLEEPVCTARDAVSEKVPGAEVRLRILRQKKERVVTLVLDSAPIVVKKMPEPRQVRPDPCVLSVGGEKALFPPCNEGFAMVAVSRCPDPQQLRQLLLGPAPEFCLEDEQGPGRRRLWPPVMS